MPINALTINDWIGYAIGTAGIVIGVAVSYYFYREAKIHAERFGEEARQRRLEEYLAGSVAQQASSLLAKSLYAHLPLATASTFSNAWVRKIVEDLPEQLTRDQKSLCRQTRLLIEQVHIDCVQAPAGPRLDAATWPGQNQAQHFDSLKSTYLRAQSHFGEAPNPHVLETSFALHALTESMPPVSSYFETLLALDLPKDVLGRPDRFISQVRIQSGFVAPLHLVTGLLTHMKSDWPHVLTQYKRAISRFPLPSDVADNRPDLVLEHVQAFQFYCWLLWGPSIQLCECQAWFEGNIRILQYGYGDENNSLNLVFDDPELTKDSWKEIQAGLLDAGRPYPLAVQTELTATPMWGPSLTVKLPWIYDPLEKDGALEKLGLLLHCDATVDAHNPIMQKLPYYSAYVWIMFEICDPLQRLKHWRKEPWRYYFPIFEHGNIADGTTYLFSKRALVRKAMAMIESIEDSFTRDGQPEVYLRYVCALDDPGGFADEHTLQFKRDPAAKPDWLSSLLYEAADEPRRQRLFEEPSPQSAELLLDTSCHLTSIVETFYQSLATRG